MYSIIRLLLLIHPFICSFFFLSNFQTLKFFITLFSGTVRTTKLKLSTHMDSGWMYTGIRLLLLVCPFICSFFLSFIFLILNIFVTVFSGTVWSTKLKLSTDIENGWLYRVYQNQAAAAYCPLISSFFFLFNFQTKIFCHCFLRKVETWCRPGR